MTGCCSITDVRIAGAAGRPRPATTILPPLAPPGIDLGAGTAEDASSDVDPLLAAGVLVSEYPQDASSYFDIHHSADGTLDKVNRANLGQNVAPPAVLLAVVGKSTRGLRKPD